MTSTAAKREQIQVKLQQLRERRVREQAAFDVIAAAHPELSAQEIWALAQQKAEEEVPRRLVVDGKEVNVGDKVTVKDDVNALQCADRGYFGPDVLKPIYCGERAEVVRVMESFQGKPAMELRFADGVTKVFFTECIAIDGARGGRADGTVAARPTNASGGDIADVSIFVPPVKAAPPSPKADALPDWSQLSMPHRKPTRGNAHPAAAAAPPLPTSPPSTVAAKGTREPTSASTVAKAKSDTAPSKPASSTKLIVATAPVVKDVPAKVCRASTGVPRKASPHPVSSSLSPSVVRMASSCALSRHAATPPTVTSLSQDDISVGLGAPFSELEKEGMLHVAHADGDAEEVPELRPTPDSTVNRFSASSPASSPASSTKTAPQEEKTGDPTNTTARQLPQACATTYQAKYELQDETSRIPRRQSTTTPTSGARTCWVCGITKTDAPLSEPVQVIFQSRCITMFALFAVLTRKLQWDKLQITVSRLFTEKGVEIKTASTVRHGMRLVATAGCEYRPAAHPDAFSSVPETRPSPAASKNPESPLSPFAPKNASATLQRNSAATAAVTSNAAVAAGAARPKKSLPPSSLLPISAPSKPKHIRVYENGLYDDNIYRTVTVRPTYKTLMSLKTTITRELQWRDGKKVDLLFDACGAEIRDIDAICDGDVVVASAGDRFVIPFPNTPMHLEAMKLSERLNPTRKC